MSPFRGRSRFPHSFHRLALFFGLFLYGLVGDMATPHLMDNVFMQLQAGGHALFRVFGLTAAVAGGTFLQLFIPLALGFYYIRQRQTLGVALCMFFFFEQFLPIARYMADAQAQQLPWISIGRYESLIHDWNYLFTKLGVLSYDTVVARIVAWMSRHDGRNVLVSLARRDRYRALRMI